MAIIIKSSELNERRIREFIEHSNTDRKNRKLQLVCGGQVRASASLTDEYIEVITDEQAENQ